MAYALSVMRILDGGGGAGGGSVKEYQRKYNAEMNRVRDVVGQMQWKGGMGEHIEDD